MAQRLRPVKNQAKSRSHAVRILRAGFPLLVLLWVLLILYPNPARLALSVRRLAAPRVDSAAVETLAVSLPSDPAAIEEAVLASIPYQYDWEVYGMPWYYPTVDEVLKNGRGDCKGRAIVLASVFEAKGIPYRLQSSPTHVWVDHEGKGENAIENPEVGFYAVDSQTGARSLRLPGIDLVEFADVAWGGFWPPMPVARKVLLISGLVILTVLRVAWLRRGESAPGELSPSYATRLAARTAAGAVESDGLVSKARR